MEFYVAVMKFGLSFAYKVWTIFIDLVFEKARGRNVSDHVRCIVTFKQRNFTLLWKRFKRIRLSSMTQYCNC
jgi:hypothetical protein